MIVRFSSGEPPRTEMRLSNSVVAAIPGSVCSARKTLSAAPATAMTALGRTAQLGRRLGLPRPLGHDLDLLPVALLRGGRRLLRCIRDRLGSAAGRHCGDRGLLVGPGREDGQGESQHGDRRWTALSKT